MNLKKLITMNVVGWTLLAAPFVKAFTYANGDVLLIFRTASGLNNIEFNLGTISQFLNHPDGYTVAVTNWSPSVVTSYYPLTNGDAQFLLLASDATNTSWVSDSQPLITVSDFTLSRWSASVNGPIESTGQGAAHASLLYSLAPANTNYEIFPLPNPNISYDGIAGALGASGIPRLGGGALNFNVTATTPTTVLFYQVQSSSLSPKPAGALIGSFTLDATGGLTFRAGPLLDAPWIASIAPVVSSSGGTLMSVGFDTKAAVKYRLLYTTQLTNGSAAWAILPNPLAGDGNPQNLYDDSPTDAARFYRVESF